MYSLVFRTSKCPYHLISLQNNPSDNLLGEEVYRKWKGASPGEKQLTVVIQVIGRMCTVLYVERMEVTGCTCVCTVLWREWIAIIS